MPRRIRVLERIAADIHVPIVVEEHPRIGDQRIRREELAERGEGKRKEKTLSLHFGEIERR
jgi:hypothetical protein